MHWEWVVKGNCTLVSYFHTKKPVYTCPFVQYIRQNPKVAIDKPTHGSNQVPIYAAMTSLTPTDPKKWNLPP